MSKFTPSATSKHVKTPDVEIHYHDVGQGEPMIVLHGGGPGASGWANFHRNIETLAQQFHLYVLDQPNFGRSGSVVIREPRSQFQARVVRDVMDGLGVPKAHFLGNSMGGATSINVALDYPDRVNKLVLVSPGGGGRSIFSPYPYEHTKVIRQVAANPTPEGMRRLMELVVFDSSFLTDAFLAGRTKDALHEKHRDAARKSSVEERDLMAELHRVQAPTLLVWGREDRAVPLDVGIRMFAALGDCRMHVFSKCSHWPQFEHADAFNRLALDFLGNA